MRKLSKQHFWNWFSRHHQEYLGFQNKPKKEAAYWLNELNAHLRAYYKFLGFTLEWTAGQPATLTITVDGNVMHFAKVDALVNKAPELPGWNFVALQIPRPIDFLLEEAIADTGIDPREFYFSFADDDPYHTELIIYHPLCTSENKLLIENLAHMAIYNLLGERSFGMDIHGLEAANLSTADTDDIEKLEELVDCIGLRKSGVVVDGEGRLVEGW